MRAREAAFFDFAPKGGRGKWEYEWLARMLVASYELALPDISIVRERVEWRL